MSPRRNRDHPTPLPQARVPPPPELKGGGGHTRLRMRGFEFPIQTTGEKAQYSVYYVAQVNEKGLLKMTVLKVNPAFCKPQNRFLDESPHAYIMFTLDHQLVLMAQGKKSYRKQGSVFCFSHMDDSCRNVRNWIQWQQAYKKYDGTITLIFFQSADFRSVPHFSSRYVVFSHLSGRSNLPFNVRQVNLNLNAALTPLTV